ncbi:hypothetical protein CEXT_221951 [Caerostris extrusa]|uniref:Uncharacterized protein n=1 Tax=Caerostris extrusa TaxID=172846 RepID=A0AAV4XMJ3_CAEEX|nr:hypothetical protein CEXT_221951 [Caerostris extrusa]
MLSIHRIIPTQREEVVTPICCWMESWPVIIRKQATKILFGKSRGVLINDLQFLKGRGENGVVPKQGQQVSKCKLSTIYFPHLVFSKQLGYDKISYKVVKESLAFVLLYPAIP